MLGGVAVITETTDTGNFYQATENATDAAYKNIRPPVKVEGQVNNE